MPQKGQLQSIKYSKSPSSIGYFQQQVNSYSKSNIKTWRAAIECGPDGVLLYDGKDREKASKVME